MKCFQDLYEAIANDGFTQSTLHIIDELVNQIENGSTDLPRFNLREHSGVARQARLSSGRPSSQATLKEALQQVAMLKAAKEAQAVGK